MKNVIRHTDVPLNVEPAVSKLPGNELVTMQNIATKWFSELCGTLHYACNTNTDFLKVLVLTVIRLF